MEPTLQKNLSGSKIKSSLEIQLADEAGKGMRSSLWLVAQEESSIVKVMVKPNIKQREKHETECELLGKVKKSSKIIEVKAMGCERIEIPISMGGGTFETCFIKEELAEMGSVINLMQIEPRRLPEGVARVFFIGMLEACGELSKLGYSHGNLIPEHILLTKEGEIKLVGFGSARKFTTGTMIEDIQTIAELTFTMVMGRPAYQNKSTHDRLFKILKMKDFETFWKMHFKSSEKKDYLPSASFQKMMNVLLDPSKQFLSSIKEFEDVLNEKMWSSEAVEGDSDPKVYIQLLMSAIEAQFEQEKEKVKQLQMQINHNFSKYRHCKSCGHHLEKFNECSKLSLGLEELCKSIEVPFLSKPLKSLGPNVIVSYLTPNEMATFILRTMETGKPDAEITFDKDSYTLGPIETKQTSDDPKAKMSVQLMAVDKDLALARFSFIEGCYFSFVKALSDLRNSFASLETS